MPCLSAALASCRTSLFISSSATAALAGIDPLEMPTMTWGSRFDMLSNMAFRSAANACVKEQALRQDFGKVVSHGVLQKP